LSNILILSPETIPLKLKFLGLSSNDNRNKSKLCPYEVGTRYDRPRQVSETDHGYCQSLGQPGIFYNSRMIVSSSTFF
jgi:hypothetical protein